MTELARPDRLYAGYIFDMDGTIYLGEHLLPGVAEVIGLLRERGATIRYLSNNPTRTPPSTRRSSTSSACRRRWRTSSTPWCRR